MLALGTDPAPSGRPYVPISFTNPAGERDPRLRDHARGRAPVPRGRARARRPQLAGPRRVRARRPGVRDAGYAVLLVNYRGSTGRDAAFRERLRGDIGFPESEDILAGLDHVVAQGLVDPARVALEGWSWGGYLTLLNAGLHPDRWRAALGGIPVGDSVAAHYECAPALRAWDIATMGGSPMEVPELFRERNPLTYVDRVEAPVLLIAGEHDSRCPLGQVMVVRARAARPAASGGRPSVRGRSPRERRERADPAHGARARVLREARPRRLKPPPRTRSPRSTRARSRPRRSPTYSSSIGDDDSYCGNFSYSRFRSRSNSIPVSMKYGAP